MSGCYTPSNPKMKEIKGSHGSSGPASTPQPFHTCRPSRLTLSNRLFAAIYISAITALLFHHVSNLRTSETIYSIFASSLLLTADTVFAFMWVTLQAFRMRPVYREESLESLQQSTEFRSGGPPSLDVFVCTADPYKEPPLGVANTVLSLMGYDYPPEQLSVYVSDDGGSELTLFAMMEAMRFAEHWLPFCRLGNVMTRSPEAYFEVGNGDQGSNEVKKIKGLYDQMKMRIEHVMDQGRVSYTDITHEDQRGIFRKWTDDFSRQNHPAVIQVLSESRRNRDSLGHPMPNFIYMSREKRPNSSHHFKAGALNALLKISTIMTNAPVILTQDCDMFSNDPQTPFRALCYLMDPSLVHKLAFVQFPQKFKGINRTDIYASELKRLFHINFLGLDGFSGPNMVGTGCFFNRRAFFGSPKKLELPDIPELNPISTKKRHSISQEGVMKLAYKVVGCEYEKHTSWGSKMGFRYGSLVEDYYTGYRLQCEGWRSVFCNPKRVAFYGDAPVSLYDVLSQQKRWGIGLWEVTFSRNYSTLTYGIKKLGLLNGLCYCHYSSWPIWSFPLVVYAIFPQLTLLYGQSIFPKASEPWFFLYLFLFLAAYGQDLMEYVIEGGNVKKWWNDQRMWMIRGLSSFLNASLEYMLKSFGLSTPSFNVTSKASDQDRSKLYDHEYFDFGVSTFLFLPLAIIATINLIALVSTIAKASFDHGDASLLETLLTSFVVLNCIPIYGTMLWRRDKGKMPSEITFIALFSSSIICVIASMFLT